MFGGPTRMFPRSPMWLSTGLVASIPIPWAQLAPSEKSVSYTHLTLPTKRIV